MDELTLEESCSGAALDEMILDGRSTDHEAVHVTESCSSNTSESEQSDDDDEYLVRKYPYLISINIQY